MKALYVGDVHAVPDELEDCQNLIQHVGDVAVSNKVDIVVFLGDLHHTHSIMKLEVVRFWRRWFALLRDMDIPEVIALKGNHDTFVDASQKGSALDAYRDFEPWLTIVDQTRFLHEIVFVPYCHTEEEFLNSCKVPAKTLVCHQTFDGARYENGFPASDGFDLEKVPQQEVISGHIHTPAQVGKCCYIGAPRWRTRNDANVKRNIWVVEHASNGSILSKTGFDTGKVCRQIRSVEITPSSPDINPADYDPKHEWHVDLVGPSDWIDKNKKTLDGTGVRVRTTKVDKALPKVRESEGVDKAFLKYLDKYTPKHGTSMEILRSMVKDRLSI